MHLSFTGKIRAIILLLLLISLFQGFIILQIMGSLNQYEAIKQNIQNTIYITWFLQFVFSIFLVFYLPVFLQKAFSEIHNKLKEIAQGKYNIDVNLSVMKKSVDKEFFAVMVSIKEMLKSIRMFDMLKKEKIVEHHNRIKAILGLTNEGFIIMDIKGNIAFVNDIVLDLFPQFDGNVNVIDNNFPPEIENHIKKYMVQVIKSETKKEPVQFFNPSLKRHINLSCAVIRNIDGKAKGAVFALMNLEKKKSETAKDNS